MFLFTTAALATYTTAGLSVIVWTIIEDEGLMDIMLRNKLTGEISPLPWGHFLAVLAATLSPSTLSLTVPNLSSIAHPVPCWPLCLFALLCFCDGDCVALLRRLSLVAGHQGILFVFCLLAFYD